ncbi:MAG: type II toxin-antitoxin system ParD family antitoxin [Rhodospirillaceae bacterium]|nr:type II toxin-antitoxin system ParD family antitoxin [Rhodospirillaceae bacterium]
MNIHLTPKLEKFVRSKVGSGLYNNASEVMRAAVRLLMQHEEERAQKLKRLRALIKEGDDAVAAGDVTVLANDREIDAFFRKL